MENWRSYIANENFDQKCILYLKEAKEIKKVALDDLVEQYKSGLINKNHFHNIWCSSTLYESYRFETYIEAFRSLNEHMISEGLVYKSGSLTKKGKILERKEKDLDDSQFKLITEKLEKSLAEHGLKLLLEQEEEEEEEEPSEEDKEIAQMAAASRTGFQKGAAALGKGLKAFGKNVADSATWKVLSAPFKVIKWFRDKIWEGMKALFMKLWSGLKTLGEKYNIEWVKKLVATAEKIVEKVNKFCQKSKFLRVVCSIVKTLIVAYLVTIAIQVMMAALGATTGMIITAALGGCAAGAASGLASESKKLNESAAYCEMAAKAGKAATSGTINLIKGAIKMVAAGTGEEQEVVTGALSYMDSLEKTLDASYSQALHLDPDVISTEVFADVKMMAANYNGKGHELVNQSLEWTGKYVEILADSGAGQRGRADLGIHDMNYMMGVGKEMKNFFEPLVDLGKASTPASNMDSLYDLFDGGQQAYTLARNGKTAEAQKMVDRGDKLMNALGWDWNTQFELSQGFGAEGEGIGDMMDLVNPQHGRGVSPIGAAWRAAGDTPIRPR